ncbi:DUF1842 domain-containing protein [Flavicella sp.]|uniref:DUF1842 domain-containing protein n=1 Tax=Flavicella sp. TaxID=2957742 RepID=UPI002608AACB|nr:DUF1842 domain-containing protein [Flavicella sp.]MDG1803645.1 DUF1842 domain-containing protein [Flavicella sp.]MDG2279894.1 DUF1842 domain-containing protein [Flavicella sp.]
MSTVTESQTNIASAYLTKGTIGNVGLPGAPIAHFSLVVIAATNTVSGVVEITQAIDAKPIQVHVTGNIRYTGYGKVTKIVNLKGQYVVSVPPPAIGSYLQDFTAFMDIDDSWNGVGGFTYGNTDIKDVPVNSDN